MRICLILYTPFFIATYLFFIHTLSLFFHSCPVFKLNIPPYSPFHSLYSPLLCPYSTLPFSPLPSPYSTILTLPLLLSLILTLPYFFFLHSSLFYLVSPFLFLPTPLPSPYSPFSFSFTHQNITDEDQIVSKCWKCLIRKALVNIRLKKNSKKSPAHVDLPPPRLRIETLIHRHINTCRRVTYICSHAQTHT